MEIVRCDYCNKELTKHYILVSSEVLEVGTKGCLETLQNYQICEVCYRKRIMEIPKSEEKRISDEIKQELDKDYAKTGDFG